MHLLNSCSEGDQQLDILLGRQQLLTMRLVMSVTDIDLLGHVNNAAQWAPVEQALHLSGWTPGSIRAELEHGPGVEADSEVHLRWLALDGGVDTWLTTNGVAGSVARVRPLKPPTR